VKDVFTEGVDEKVEGFMEPRETIDDFIHGFYLFVEVVRFEVIEPYIEVVV
jgi:hypothetical protein